LIKENINKTQILKKISPVIEKIIEECGLIPVEVDLVQESNIWSLRIYIYNPQKPITHENCETVTKKIDKYLDEMISEPYRLEVGSPGTERKFKSGKEYEIFKGQRVKIKLKKNEEKESKIFLAKILNYAEQEGLIVELPDSGDVLTLKKEEISSVKLEPEYKF